MKLVNKIDMSAQSPFMGRSQQTIELFMKPRPVKDENGVPLKAKQRYYVFRLLNWETENRKNSPFIIRNEHEFYTRDPVSKKITNVRRIVCPTSIWAKAQINEEVGKDYCPICSFSFNQQKAGWKNWQSAHTVDKTCLDLARESERKWAAYVPVYVVSDPNYDKNNNHAKVIRFAGEHGVTVINRLRDLIIEADKNGLSIFNGDMGVNVAMLCERVQKTLTNKKGEPIIDQATGNPRTYFTNEITDIRLMTAKTYAYTNIDEQMIEALHFDETYGVAAAKDELSVFLNETYLNTGASDDDFDGIDESDFGDEEVVNNTVKETVAVQQSSVAETAASEDLDNISEDDLNDAYNESAADTVSRLSGVPINTQTVKMKSTVAPQVNVEQMRNDSTTFSPNDDDDLPF